MFLQHGPIVSLNCRTLNPQLFEVESDNDAYNKQIPQAIITFVKKSSVELAMNCKEYENEPNTMV